MGPVFLAVGSRNHAPGHLVLFSGGVWRGWGWLGHGGIGAEVLETTYLPQGRQVGRVQYVPSVHCRWVFAEACGSTTRLTSAAS